VIGPLDPARMVAIVDELLASETAKPGTRPGFGWLAALEAS
jgi:hypothetical protein